MDGQRFHLMGEPWRTRYYIEGWMHLTARIKKTFFLPADVQPQNRSRPIETGEKEKVLAGEMSNFSMPD